VFTPSLAAALNRGGDDNPEAFNSFAGQLQRRLARRLADNPIPADTKVQTLVVAKQS
jgi:hypothetical protein